MYVPLPFPFCPKCKKDGRQSYHKPCGGELQVDPETQVVKCSCCRKTWKLLTSGYYCSCGHTFTADEVKDELLLILDACKACVLEIELASEARRRRITLSAEAIGWFVSALLTTLDICAKKVIETVIELVIGWWKARK